MKFDYKSLIVMFIILAPISLLFNLINHQPVTIGQFVSLAIIIIVVDILFVLRDRNKSQK